MSLTNKTISDLLTDQVTANPTGIALEYEDELFTWKNIQILSDKAAVGLFRRGVRKKDHVGIFSINTPNWIITFFAIIKLGALPILLNMCYKNQELTYAVKDTDIKFLCYGDGYKKRKYSEMIFNSSQDVLKKDFLIDIGKNSDDSWNGLKEKTKEISANEIDMLEKSKSSINSKDLAAILFTSGTLKKPKGVMLTHHNLVNNAIDTAKSMRWTNKDRVCVSVPLFHCFGVTTSLLASTYIGSSMHLLSYYKTTKVLEKIEKYKCTILNGVPSMFLAMIHNECLDSYDISSIESGIIAGSSISSIDYLNIVEKLKIDKLQPSYGQTESSPCITVANFEDDLEIKSVSAGKKLDTLSLRIMNMFNNKEAKINEVGEIQTKGYHVMKGYYNLEKETEKVLSEDGWLRTGDLGYIDELGNLHISGRINELIIRGGENISPKEIEEELLKFNEIKDVKVIGIESKVLQEEIAACIILKDKIKLDETEFENYLKENLIKNISDYKVPKYILFLKKFPLSASGKILSSILKEKANEQIKLKYKEEKIEQKDCTRVAAF